MERTLLKDIEARIGHEIKFQGFVTKVRDQKKMQFVIVRDHSGVIQAALEKTEINRSLNLVISTLTSESAVEVTGLLVKDPAIKFGGVEIRIKDLKVVSLSESILPIDITNNTDTERDKRLDWRFLDLRRPENYLIFQIQTTAEMAMREFWLADGFVEIHSPKFLGTPSESGAELFALDYFGKTAYLAQSPQFYKQMGMAAGFNKVFEIGPVFRANPSFTTRHDTEFTSVDVEISWIDSHYDVMAFEERWLQHVLQVVKEKHGEQIRETFGNDLVIPTTPFPKISMEEAQKILKSLGHVPPAETKEGDLDPLAEKLMCEYVRQQFHGHEFVFVIDYPISVRPFYHMRYEKEPAKTKSYDLLWNGIEVTTGAQREHRYDVLCRQALEKGLRLEPIQFYLDFFKYGCPPHGGFGLGLTRLLMVMLDRSNVRDVTYLFRGPNRLTP
jgi:nondiscriminating aspartyl-tRNA synthetase